MPTFKEFLTNPVTSKRIYDIKHNIDQTKKAIEKMKKEGLTSNDLVVAAAEANVTRGEDELASIRGLSRDEQALRAKDMKDRTRRDRDQARIASDEARCQKAPSVSSTHGPGVGAAQPAVTSSQGNIGSVRSSDGSGGGNESSSVYPATSSTSGRGPQSSSSSSGGRVGSSGYQASRSGSSNVRPPSVMPSSGGNGGDSSGYPTSLSTSGQGQQTASSSSGERDASSSGYEASRSS
ncbi:hypothetical protein BD410DRAFT_803562 [Rickenella mellea]|uniref:Uncharacterized protein n=1 Tax=Rickenella mellea TaxID=50990 RepID=A0A4Y7Q5D8_9AGAM|nr:hypothetical protein BD410DRAFT_803562 [Rickenella mellea]